MTRDEFDKFCSSLKATTHVIQWGNASVWKVGGKIFAICSSWGVDGGERIAFKCSDLAYEILSEQPGFRPAPYLARAKWVQLVDPQAMSADELKAQIEAAHTIVASGLTKAVKSQLGLDVPANTAKARNS